MASSIYSFFYQNSFAQCCSGANPIAGGLAQGVLQEKQMEVSINYQYVESDFALTGDTLAPFRGLEKVFSSYLYFRFAYGLSKKLTVSVESGYSIERTERLIGGMEITGKGIGDLIIFPKYDLFNKTTHKHQTEVTVGLGSKIPLGEYNQKYVAYVNPATNDTIFFKKSPGIQPSSGTNDFLFYAFLYRGYTKMSNIEERVKKIVAEQLGVKAEEVTNEASFIDDLGADSLDTVELVMALEEEFDCEIPDEQAEGITTVQQAIDYVNSNAE